MNLPQYQPDAVDIERLKRLAEHYGVYYTIHLDENFNPFDFNSAVAQAWLETLRRTVRIAAALAVPILNMHLPAGVYFTLPDRRVYLFETYREMYRDRLRAFRALYESEAGAAGPRLCIENCGGWLPFQLEALAELLESDGFGLTLDVGTAPRRAIARNRSCWKTGISCAISIFTTCAGGGTISRLEPANSTCRAICGLRRREERAPWRRPRPSRGCAARSIGCAASARSRSRPAASGMSRKRLGGIAFRRICRYRIYWAVRNRNRERRLYRPFLVDERDTGKRPLRERQKPSLCKHTTTDFRIAVFFVCAISPFFICLYA